jgi:hypothetical protein
MCVGSVVMSKGQGRCGIWRCGKVSSVSLRVRERWFLEDRGANYVMVILSVSATCQPTCFGNTQILNPCKKPRIRNLWRAIWAAFFQMHLWLCDDMPTTGKSEEQMTAWRVAHSRSFSIKANLSIVAKIRRGVYFPCCTRNSRQ